MPYQLLATDLDGTLLNSQKVLPPENAAAINRALNAGKIVVFSTGRCIGELKTILPTLPTLRYVIGESGACLYDLQGRCALYRRPLDAGDAKAVLDYIRGRDIMPQVLSCDESVLNRRNYHNLSHFRVAHYYQHFTDTALLVDEVCEHCAERLGQIEKFCLYHPTPKARAVTRAALSGLNAEMVDTEETSLEISPGGVDKGRGLERLCLHLNIPLSETIAVGDSCNDLPILQKAGLAVAVDNANPEVKSACQAVVADCDYAGVAEAIERFLLD